MSLKLSLYKYINEYTNDEIIKIIKVCVDKHYDHGLGVCLDQQYHSIFHQFYGYSNTTEKDFEEFKIKFYNFEFDQFLDDKYKWCNLLKAVI